MSLEGDCPELRPRVTCSRHTLSGPQRRLQRLADDGFRAVAFGRRVLGHLRGFGGLVAELLQGDDGFGLRVCGACRAFGDRPGTAEVGDRIIVGSTQPAEIARATQAIADALETAVRRAPEQWCVFKPMWPESRDAEEALARRVAALGVASVTPCNAGPVPEAAEVE